MTKQELFRSVLTDLLAFEETRKSANTTATVPEFERFFRARENGVGLKSAVIHATGASPFSPGVVRNYLAGLPGVEVIEGTQEVLRISAELVSSALESPSRNAETKPSSEPTEERDDLAGWIVPVQFKKEFDDAVSFIKKHRTWTDNIDIMNEIQRKLDWIKQIVPGRWQPMKDIADDGTRIAEIIDRAGDKNERHDKKNWAEWLNELKRLEATNRDMEKFEDAFNVGLVARNRLAGGQSKPAIPGIAPPDFEVNTSNPFALRNLHPSRNWTVLIDETGKLFDVKAVGTGTVDEPLRGKIVALLIPEGSSLPRLSGGDHATTDTEADVESRLEKVFLTQPRCGILGITLEGLPKVHSAVVNYWYTAIERCFDLVLRLAPIAPSGQTRFKFLVEARTDAALVESQNRMVERTLHSALCRFTRANPSRDDRIDTSVSVELKSRPADKDFIAWNGYVDALANAWNGDRPTLKADLKAYGLPGHCLLCGETQNLTSTMDALDAGDPVSTIQWTELLSAAKEDGPDSLSAVTLGKFADRVKADSRLWLDLIEETKAHLDSHAIDLRKLSEQIRWLESNRPENSELPKRLELLWLVIRLAHANHLGSTEAEMAEAKIDMARFRKLVSDLYEEDAPLVSWATLHLAVTATDSFEFSKARRIIRDFLATGAKQQANRGFFARIKARIAGSLGDQAAANPAVMGLRYHSEMISSLGQHAAFEGDNATAVKLFQQAIEEFQKLSDKKLRDDEIRRTRAYLATAAMDSDAVSDAELRGIVQKYLGADLVGAAGRLSASPDPKDKYQHHILLRYIVSGRAPQAITDAYLAVKRKWIHIVDNHPWELIEFYRAMLVNDSEEKRDLLCRAVSNTERGGLTIKAICCVIQNALAPLEPSIVDDFRRNLADVREGLPALGARRLAALERAASAPVPPLDLAKAVLPFNFR